MNKSKSWMICRKKKMASTEVNNLNNISLKKTGQYRFSQLPGICFQNRIHGQPKSQRENPGIIFYKIRGVGRKFSDNKPFENISGSQNHDKSQYGSDKCPAHHIIILYFQIVLVIGIEFRDISLHPEIGKGIDNIGNTHKCSVKAIF